LRCALAVARAPDHLHRLKKPLPLPVTPENADRITSLAKKILPIDRHHHDLQLVPTAAPR